MFSVCLEFSVSGEGLNCDKCREIVNQTEKISKLETCIQTLIEGNKNARALETALNVSLVHCSVPVKKPTASGQLGDFRTE